MLNKVLKYDLKMVGREVFPIYIAVLILAVFAKGLLLIGNHISFFNIIAVPVQAFYFIVLFGSIFATFALCIKRYYKNIYKDEGYLTNTLPVKKNDILLSKLLLSIILIIINVMIALISLWLVYGNITVLISMIDVGLEPFPINTNIFIILVVGTMFLGYLGYIMLAFVSIALGHTNSKDKLLYSIIMGIALYFICQIVSVIFFLPLFLTNLELFNHPEIIPSTNFIIGLFGTTILLLIVQIVAFYSITLHTMKHKFNID